MIPYKRMNWLKVSSVRRMCRAVRVSWWMFCSFRPIWGNPRKSLILDGFHVVDSGIQILDSGFLVSWTWITDFNCCGIPDFWAEFRIPKVEFQNPKPKIPDSTSKRLPGLHWWGDSLKPNWSKEWNRSALNKEVHFKNWMFIYYLHGSQLASAS